MNVTVAISLADLVLLPPSVPLSSESLLDLELDISALHLVLSIYHHGLLFRAHERDEVKIAISSITTMVTFYEESGGMTDPDISGLTIFGVAAAGCALYGRIIVTV